MINNVLDLAAVEIQSIRRALHAHGIPAPGNDGMPGHTLRWVQTAISGGRLRSIPGNGPSVLAAAIRAASPTEPVDVGALDWPELHAITAVIDDWTSPAGLLVEPEPTPARAVEHARRSP